jgi:hypothetical protein
MMIHKLDLTKKATYVEIGFFWKGKNKETKKKRKKEPEIST